MDILGKIVSSLDQIITAIVVILFIWAKIDGRVGKIIAIVSEIMQSVGTADDQIIKNKAIKLLKQSFPFLPDFILSAMVQMVFNGIKESANKEVAEIKSWSVNAENKAAVLKD